MNRTGPISRMTEKEFRERIEKLEEEQVQDELPEDTIKRARKEYQFSRRAELSGNEKGYFKNKFIQNILDYGFYLKGEWEEGGTHARYYFEEALEIDPSIPLAHYRLGHIYFRNKELGEAVSHFYMAIQQQMKYEGPNNFKLEDFQLANAKKILSYCALKIFDQYEPSALESSSYPELDSQIEAYLNDNQDPNQGAYIALWTVQNGITTKELIDDCKRCEIKDRVDCDRSCAYIDTYTQEPCIGYGGCEKKLPNNDRRLLLCMFKGEFDDEFKKGNTLNKTISRLKHSFTDELGLHSAEFTIENPPKKMPFIQTNLTIYIFRHIEE